MSNLDCRDLYKVEIGDLLEAELLLPSYDVFIAIFHLGRHELGFGPCHSFVMGHMKGVV